LERIVVIGFYFGVTSFETFVFWVGFGALENLGFFGLFGLRPGVPDSSVPTLCEFSSILAGFFFILGNGPISKFEEGEEEGGCFHPQILVFYGGRVGLGVVFWRSMFVKWRGLGRWGGGCGFLGVVGVLGNFGRFWWILTDFGVF
jgi:hypothetical protein